MGGGNLLEKNRFSIPDWAIPVRRLENLNGLHRKYKNMIKPSEVIQTSIWDSVAFVPNLNYEFLTKRSESLEKLQQNFENLEVLELT